MSETAKGDTPTVVLIHGAHADASNRNGVITRLQAKGVPANPLRGIAADSAYTASVFEQIEGPVLAVGHSYGGAVTSNAATDAKNASASSSMAERAGPAITEVEGSYVIMVSHLRL